MQPRYCGLFNYHSDGLDFDYEGKATPSLCRPGVNTERQTKRLAKGRLSTTQPGAFVEWRVRLRTAVVAVCSAIHHHKEQGRRRLVVALLT
jgi:hypothetical protein